MILSAQSILKRKIITPVHPRTVINGKTYGISAAGYDVRIDFSELNYRIRVLSRNTKSETDNDFLLAATLEHFNMPDDVLGVVHDKSSWARHGVCVQNTIIDPGWRGHLTLEITYHGPDKQLIQIHHGDPIAQIIFHQLDESTIFPYGGKYQDQKRGPQPAIDEKIS